MSNNCTFVIIEIRRRLPAVLLLAGLFLAMLPARASDVAEIGRLTDALVAEALESNFGLLATEADVAGRLAALDQARARFLPAIDLQLRFTRAEGGREIELPMGLPAFSFQRPREQDSLLRLTQPLYDRRLGAASRAAAAGHEAALFGLQALRLQTTRDVRQAYYRWLTARETTQILQATRDLAVENRRVNDSLHRNGKVTRDLVLRAEAELLEIEQQLLRATETELLARRYVNLLCNAPLERALPPVDVATADLALMSARLHPATRRATPAGSEEAALARRADLRELDAGLAAAAAQERLVHAAYHPQLSLAVDAGTQGPQWGYGEDDPYVLVSLVLRFNVWNGGADRAALAAARAYTARLSASRALAEQRVRLEIQEARSAFAVAEASLQTSEQRVAAALAAYEIVARKRDLGQVTPAEFLDAQRALTAARLNSNITRFAILNALAALEYATGGPE